MRLPMRLAKVMMSLGFRIGITDSLSNRITSFLCGCSGCCSIVHKSKFEWMSSPSLEPTTAASVSEEFNRTNKQQEEEVQVRKDSTRTLV